MTSLFSFLFFSSLRSFSEGISNVCCGFQGDPNASIPTIEPVYARPMFATFVPQMSITFVSAASIKSGVVDSYGLAKRVEPVKGCRTVGKKDMKFNDVMPKMKVDPETYTVEADGVVCKAEPATEVGLGQAYYIF